MEKAELAGTEASAGSRFALAPKPELSGDDARKSSKHVVAVAELEHREVREVLAELDDHETRQEEPSELGTPLHLDGGGSAEPNLAFRNGGQTTAQQSSPSPTASPSGPLPSALDLYPTPQTKKAGVDEETDFEYQARRLQKGER